MRLTASSDCICAMARNTAVGLYVYSRRICRRPLWLRSSYGHLRIYMWICLKSTQFQVEHMDMDTGQWHLRAIDSLMW